jgi:biotin operon repressor
LPHWVESRPSTARNYHQPSSPGKADRDCQPAPAQAVHPVTKEVDLGKRNCHMYHNRDRALLGVKRVPPSDRYERRLTDLQDRLEKVEKKILYLQQLLKAQSRNVYTGIRLTPNQETIVNRLLATNGICSKEQLYEALYLSREGLKPDPKILRTTIWVVRKQLRSHDIEIKTEFGKGYTMPRESKAKLRKLAVPRGKRVGST